MRYTFSLTLILFGLFCLYSPEIIAQSDKIYLKNGSIISGKVIETSETHYKIKVLRGDSELIRSFNVEEIDRVEFGDGSVEIIEHSLEVTPVLNLNDMKKMGIKVNFFGPLNGHTDITFEKYMSPGRLYELTLGIIGAGKNEDLGFLGSFNQKRDAKGLFFSGGYKFQTKPIYREKNKTYTHIMQGWFVKPTATFGFYSQNRLSGNLGQVQNESISFGALEIKFGRQWVFSNLFYLGLDFGFGYVFDNTEEDNFFDLEDIFRNHFAITKFGGDTTNLGISFLFQVGVLF